MKSLIKKVDGVLLGGFLRKLANKLSHTKRIRGWSGNYESYREATKAIGTYDDYNVANAEFAKKLIDDVTSKDDTTIDEVTLLLLAFFYPSCGKYISVLDIGGNVGDSYHLLKKHLNIKKWDIVETDSIVKIGRSDSILYFYNSLEKIKNNEYDFILSRSAIHYFENPHQTLQEIQKIKHQYLILATLPLFDHPDRLTIQHLNRGNLPYWFLSKKRILEDVSSYEIVLHYTNTKNPILLDGEHIFPCSYLLKNHQF
jgi:putative methyltransferase (TIGR04325 family)